MRLTAFSSTQKTVPDGACSRISARESREPSPCDASPIDELREVLQSPRLKRVSQSQLGGQAWNLIRTHRVTRSWNCGSHICAPPPPQSAAGITSRYRITCTAWIRSVRSGTRRRPPSSRLNSRSPTVRWAWKTKRTSSRSRADLETRTLKSCCDDWVVRFSGRDKSRPYVTGVL